MSKPSIEAMASIKNYCEKTQCRRCIFGVTRDDDYHYVECSLLEVAPCDWDISIEKGEEK